MRSAALLSAALLSACVEAKETALVAPDGVEWVAALEVSGGRVLAGSELTAWPKDQGVPVVARRDADTVLAGFSTADLASRGALAENGAAIGGRLRAPAICEPELPRPIWAATWPISGALAVSDAAELPPLTTTVLAETCPSGDAPSISVDLDCRDRRCDAEVRVTAACALAIDLTRCGDRAIAAHAGPTGDLCLDRSDAERASCAIAAYYPVGEPPFSLDRQTIVAGASDVTPDFLRSNGLLLPDLLFFGWAFDLIAVEGTVLIAAGDGRAREVCRGAVDLFGRLVALDAETMEPIATATVPPCLTRIAAVPGNGSEFLGAFAEGATFHLGRFSASAPAGRVVAREALRVSSGSHRLVDLEILPEANAIAVLFNLATDSGKGGDGGNILVVHALDSLREKSRTIFPRGQRWAMAAGAAPGELAIADHKNRAIEWWHVDTGTTAVRLALPRPGDLVDDSLLDLVFHAEPARYLGHGTRDALLFVAAARGPLLDRDYFFEEVADPVTSVTWPSDQGTALVSGLTQDGSNFRAVVARYDVTARHFQPGTFDLGFGVAGKMVADHQGRVWALLPWSGEVVRLTPPP